MNELRFEYGDNKLSFTYYDGYKDVEISTIYACAEDSLLSVENLFIDREFTQNVMIEVKKELTIGEHIHKLSINLSSQDKLEKIVCYSLTPPEIQYPSNSQFINLKVFVPNEALAAYQAHEVWGNFWNLQGFDASGVDDIEVDAVEKTVVGRYDLTGRAVSDNYKGITIVRFSDGSTKKVVL